MRAVQARMRLIDGKRPIELPWSSGVQSSREIFRAGYYC